MKNAGFFHAAATLIALAASSCAGGGFTASEKELIGKPGEGIMKLMLTGNEADSLVLRTHAVEITRRHTGSSAFATLKERMLATVQDPSNPGVGIAAPQVGVSVRLVAVQRYDKEGMPIEFYLNPHITRYSAETAAGREGCLSVPGFSGNVKRSCEIELTYTDENSFESVTEKIAGYTAVIFQHEIDHLDGILYIDRAEEVWEE